MSPHVLTIDKHRFVCGLFWQSLSRPRDLERESAELAHRIDADLAVIRKDAGVAQAGFSNSRDGVSKGMFSLAAIVSKTIALEGVNYEGRQQAAHNWLCAFKLPDGAWGYFAARDANLLPNGDFAGTKEAVVERLLSDYGLGGWNVVIGDAELEQHGFHNFCPKRIADMLPHRKDGHVRVHNWWKLRPTSRNPRPYIVAALLAALLAAAGIGTHSWLQAKKRQEEAARLQANERARIQAADRVAATAPPHPWPRKPLPADLARACLGKLAHLTPGGWALEEYICAGGTARHTWNRAGSTVGYLLETMPLAEVQAGGEKASFGEPLDLKAGSDESLLPARKLILPLQAKLQLLGLPLSYAPAPPPAPAKDAKEEPRPDWQTFTFSLLSVSVPPTDVAEALSQPGIRLERLSYRGNTWSFEGVMYAK